MFPAQQALSNHQFAVDTDNVEQLLAAGTQTSWAIACSRAAGEQCASCFPAAARRQELLTRVIPCFVLRIDQQRRQPVQANRRLFMTE